MSGCGIAPNTPLNSTRGVQEDLDAATSFVHIVRRIVRNFFYSTGWAESNTAESIRTAIHGRVFQSCMFIGLMLALFLADVCVIAQVPNSTFQDITLLLVLLFFLAEFVGLCLTDTTYFLGFFFWMDLVGTFSILLDISWVYSDIDASKETFVDSSGGTQAGAGQLVVVRSVRAAKLGARAGRLTRVLKILRYVTINSKIDGGKVQVARVISNQLNNVLSIRVAFTSICVVIVMPIFEIVLYPEAEDSMSAWPRILNNDAEEYYNCVDTNCASLPSIERHVQNQVNRFFEAYKNRLHGPFSVCLGKRVGGEFACDVHSWLRYDSAFEEPGRKASINVYVEDRFRASYSLVAPYRDQAAANIGLIVLVVVVMIGFGLLVSHSIGVIALQPLERLLSVVRDRCAQIFQYTELVQKTHNTEGNDQPPAEEYDDFEEHSEFYMLEKVVSKLAAIVKLMATSKEIEAKEDMNEEDLMALGWTQGDLAISTARKAGSKTISGGPWTSEVSIVSGVTRVLPAAVLESFRTEYFNSLDLSKEHAIASVVYTIAHGSKNESYQSFVRSTVPEDRLEKFCTAIESNYQANPFHNFAHGVDVTLSVNYFCGLIGADRFFADTTIFWMLVAACAHDVGHIGVNNQYLIDSSEPLAVKYNDRSPLENMHCATLFQVASVPEANIFMNVQNDVYKEMRKGMIAAILHTDIVKHNEMMKEMGMLYQMNSEPFDAMDPTDAITSSANHMQLALNALLHGADIVNAMKPWDLAFRIANLILDEFFAQGDVEKMKGLPVQMLNDRDKVNRPNSQIGFIEFVIAPFAEIKVNMFPQLDFLALNLSENIVNWFDMWQDETQPAPEAAAKVKARVEKVHNRCVAVTRASRGLIA
jgi:hypothetical protein